jgi:RecJ-like exonuclease
MEKRKFLVGSEIYDKLDLKISQARDMILAALKDKRPIIVRHHSDTDGYCAAVAIERAILSLLPDYHRRESDMYYYYRRLPSRTPYYDFMDASKDLTSVLSDHVRHGHKIPLVIVLDNGSSQEDLAALRKLKIYDVQTMVIDHHTINPDNDRYIDLHLNPRQIEDSFRISAGMLAAEVAFRISPHLDDLPLVAAVAGVGDRITGDIVEGYIGQSQKSAQDLKKISDCLDFEGFMLGFTESRYLIDDLLGKDKKKQEKLLDLIYSIVKAKKDQVLESIKHYMKIEQAGSMAIASLEYDMISFPNEYPRYGIIVSMMLRHAKSLTQKPVLAYGISDSKATFRIDDGLDIYFQRFIDTIRHTLPYAQVKGGGHEKAGTISFVPMARQKVQDLINRIARGEA